MAERYHAVTIGGEEIRLRIRIGDLLHIHKALGGHPLAQIFQQLLLWDAQVILTLLQYSRRHEEPRFSPADAVALLDKWTEEGADMEAVAEHLAATLSASGIIRSPSSGEAPKSPDSESEEGDDSEEPEGKA